MVMAGALLGYAACLGWIGDRLLARAAYRARTPLAALWLWHGLAVAVVAILFIGLTMLAHDVWEHSLAWALHADKSRVHAAYAPPGELAWQWNVSLVLVWAIGVVALITTCRLTQRTRQTVALQLRLPDVEGPAQAIGSTDLTEVAVIRQSTPAIYCLPRGACERRIVVTTAACKLLNAEQLAAAIEHERAHLRRRHLLMVMVAEVTTTALRWTGLLRSYAHTVRLLVELDADDQAAARHGRRTVASALLEMSSPNAGDRSVGLAMVGSAAAFRIRRLLGADRPTRSRIPAWTATAAAIALVGVPLAAAAQPIPRLIGSAHTSGQAEPSGQGSNAFVHHR